MTSTLERQFMYYLRALAPEWAEAAVEQYRIVPGRRYAWDVAFVEQRVAIELQGGLWSAGAHSRPKGILRDYDKHNLATAHGWRCLYFAADHLEDDPADVIAQVKSVLERAS